MGSELDDEGGGSFAIFTPPQLKMVSLGVRFSLMLPGSGTERLGAEKRMFIWGPGSSVEDMSRMIRW